jgi:transcriptional regulator with XRE-family HTH domain
MVERIRELCRRDGINLKRLEEAVGIGNGIIARWSKSVPSADKLAAVAEYFGVSMEYLLTGKETAPAREEPELSEDEIILLSAFRSLTEDQRRFVLRQLRAAAQEPGDQAGV